MSWDEKENLEDGDRETGSRPSRRGRDYHFWPTQVLDQLIVLFLVLSGLVGLAVLLPVRALGPADPLNRPEAIKPQWYFLPVHQLTHYLPAWIVAGLVLLGALVLLVWPVLEAEIARHLGRQAGRALGVLVLAGLLMIGALGLLSDRTWVVLGHYVRVDTYGLPHSVPAADAGVSARALERSAPTSPPTAPSALNPAGPQPPQPAAPAGTGFIPPPLAATAGEIGYPITPPGQVVPPGAASAPSPPGSFTPGPPESVPRSSQP